MSQIHERKATISTEIVLTLLNGNVKKDDERTEIPGTGVKAHVSGLRLATFKIKGIKCVVCGVEGSFFSLERLFSKKDREVDLIVKPYHLNLYAVVEKETGTEEVLMTHDHILARGLGGADELENCQTMCSPCNSEKSVEEGKRCAEYRAANRLALNEERHGKGTSVRARKNRARKLRNIAALTNILSDQAAVVQSM